MHGNRTRDLWVGMRWWHHKCLYHLGENLGGQLTGHLLQKASQQLPVSGPTLMHRNRACNIWIHMRWLHHKCVYHPGEDLGSQLTGHLLQQPGQQLPVPRPALNVEAVGRLLLDEEGQPGTPAAALPVYSGRAALHLHHVQPVGNVRMPVMSLNVQLSRASDQFNNKGCWKKMIKRGVVVCLPARRSSRVHWRKPDPVYCYVKLLNQAMLS